MEPSTLVDKLVIMTGRVIGLDTQALRFLSSLTGVDVITRLASATYTVAVFSVIGIYVCEGMTTNAPSL